MPTPNPAMVMPPKKPHWMGVPTTAKALRNAAGINYTTQTGDKPRTPIEAK